MKAPLRASASLPMYNLPEMRDANARFWEALRGLLAERGLADLPADLEFERRPVPPRIGPEVLFTQTCGYPLETVFRGQTIRLGAPCYEAAGCDGPTHRAFFIVREGSSARSLTDLRGGVFLLNSPVSNSGMNLPRRALAEIAGGQPLFARTIETGGHPASLDLLLRGEGDVASIDCVTYAFWRRHRPAAAQRVRIVAETPPSPSIPFVTSVETSPEIVAVLRAALSELGKSPRYAAVRESLLMTDIVDVPDAAYRGLLDYEREAAALGYPVLA
jgi:ABC-type phosphate/phosphonate transport system substrate-binding protein